MTLENCLEVSTKVGHAHTSHSILRCTHEMCIRVSTSATAWINGDTAPQWNVAPSSTKGPHKCSVGRSSQAQRNFMTTCIWSTKTGTLSCVVRSRQSSYPWGRGWSMGGRSGGFQGMGNALSFDLSAGYMGAFNLWELIQLFIYDTHTYETYILLQ